MKKSILLLIVIIIGLFYKVNAAIELEACTTEKMKNLKDIASKIEFNYVYNMKKNNDYEYPEFTINATNLNEELKALIIEDFYSMNYREFKNDGNGNGSLGGFTEGQNVTITMKAFTPDQCSTRTVLVKQIKLPYYNRFYDEEFCKTNPNFKYCSEFIDVNLTQGQYDKEMNKYIEENTSNIEPIIEDNDSDNMIIIIAIVIGIVVVITVITVFIVKRRKKNSL